MALTQFNIRETKKVFPRKTDESHQFEFVPFKLRVVGLPEMHFHFDSSVLLPDYHTAPPGTEGAKIPRITSLAVLAEALREATRKPEEQVVIAGHADPAGDAAYNVRLSQFRADNVLFALTGERDKWVESCVAQQHRPKGAVEDYQLILRWIARDWGFDCDPGVIDNVLNANTKKAIKSFQERYNDEFKPKVPIATDGAVGPGTWGAFFDVYMEELREIFFAETTEKPATTATTDRVAETTTRLAEPRKNLKFVSPAKRSVGCGENFPLLDPPDPPDPEYTKERVGFQSRRVEILFFAPPELPLLDCHPSPGACKPELCELNFPLIFTRDPFQVPPILPRFTRLFVHLQLAYEDPEKVNHRLPEGFPVTVVFADKTTLTSPNALAADGKLDFAMDRGKGTFTLGFDFSAGGNGYLANSTPGAPPVSPPDQLVREPDLQGALDKKMRLFELPQKFALKPLQAPDFAGSDWKADGAAAVEFPRTQDTATVGTIATPVQLVLDPHWQHYKFQYFDRRIGPTLKQRLSIPQIMVEGFFNLTTPNTQATGDKTKEQRIRSNWITSPDGCQCVPWILRKRIDASDIWKQADGSIAPAADGNGLVQFRTVGRANNLPGTYIDSRTGDAAGRKLLSATPAPAGDPGLNHGEAFDAQFKVTDLDKPSAVRLSFYDLPAVWKSRTYFAQQAAAGDVFEKMAVKQTTNTTPLVFSLDDIVLTDDKLQPVAWKPAANNFADRVAVFVNTFDAKDATGTAQATLSPIGLYNSNAAEKRTFFSRADLKQTDKLNYIVDYPNWTRLVVAQGNYFDCFDQRLPDGASRPVGARAGVRWVDSPPVSPPGKNPARPLPTRTREFCIVQPFFEQRHDMWWTGPTTDDRGTGRFDLGLFRCCELAADGKTEIARAVTYFRFSVNFNPPANPSSNPAIGPDNPPAFNTSPAATPLNLTGVAANDWADVCCREIANRWSVKTIFEGAEMNPGPALLLPVDKAANPLEVRAMWFVQNFPRSAAATLPAIAHYELGIFKPTAPDTTVRAYMGSDVGYGSLDQTENKPTPGGGGWFTAAHETGHGGSLGDEYIEPTSPTGTVRSPWMDGFDSNMPGGPYFFDDNAMMVANAEVRGRYFWHLAEWLRFMYKFDFVVNHGTIEYKLPHMTPPRNPAQPYLHTHVNWPMNEAHDATQGTRGKFDGFFFPFGDDSYNRLVLPGKVNSARSAPLAAVAKFDGMAMVVVRMKWNFAANSTTTTTIHRWLQQIDRELKRNYNFKFMTSGTIKGVAFSRILLQFVPRYHVPNNYSPKAPQTTGMAAHFDITTQATGASAWTGAASHALKFTLQSDATNKLSAATLSDIVNRYGEMMGLAIGGLGTAANFNPIAAKVVPGAIVTAINS